MNTKHPFLSEEEEALLQAEEKNFGHPLEELPKIGYSMCFACGEDNHMGLHLHFFSIENGSLALFTPKHEHQSYNDRMHGGLVLTLLDEVIGNYLWIKDGAPAYTAKMESRFRSPVLIGEPVKIIAKEIKRKGALVVMEGQVIKKDGTIACECTSHMMRAEALH